MNGTDPSYRDYPPSLAHLPDVDFAIKDAGLVKTEVIRDYEAAYLTLTGVAKVLAPADPIRMFLLTIAQQISHERVVIDQGCKMNLLKYSRGGYLDNVVGLYGPRMDRLPAAPAVTVLEFTLTATLSFEVVIAPGAAAMTINDIVFATDNPITIPAGQRTGSSPATCQTPGRVGNGYVPGQVSNLNNWNQPYGVNVRNITETVGGSEPEADDRYRYRGWLAPESFSTCGCEDAYRYWALQAHPDIIQCVVYSAPEIAGEAHLYPLLRGGQIPTQEILDLVLAMCNPKDKRPTTDYVTAYFPNTVEYKVHVEFWVLQDNLIPIDQIIAAVNQAVDDWILWTRGAIGGDIIPDELIRRVIAAGAKRVAGPGSGSPGPYTPILPTYQFLNYNQLGILSTDSDARVVTFRGFEPA
jgi:phage-related baseplate assembly protein